MLDRLFRLLRTNKRWLIPIAVTALLVMLALYLASGSSEPFVYNNF